MLSNEIRKKIELRYGSPIRYSKDCEALARSIANACKQQISITTLKRLLGFAKSIESPRLYTLDTLAEYLGYSDWVSLDAEQTALQQKRSNTDQYDNFEFSNPEEKYMLQLILNNAKSTGIVNATKVEALCRKFAGTAEISAFIIELISIAGKSNNFEYLSTIFDLPGLFDEGIQDKGRIYYTGQAIGLMMRENEVLALRLIPIYAKHPLAQKYLIEWFVDEDYLLGYYGRLLDAYHLFRNQNKQDIIFYACLKFIEAWKRKDLDQQQQYASILNGLNIDPLIHPIPVARMIGILIAEGSSGKPLASSTYFKQICDYVGGLPYDVAIAFYFYLIRELYRFKQIEWMQLVSTLFNNQFPDPSIEEKSHWGLKVENQLWLYRCFTLYCMGKIPEAIDLYARIDIELFDPFIAEQMHSDHIAIGKILCDHL